MVGSCNHGILRRYFNYYINVIRPFVFYVPASFTCILVVYSQENKWEKNTHFVSHDEIICSADVCIVYTLRGKSTAWHSFYYETMISDHFEIYSITLPIFSSHVVFFHRCFIVTLFHLTYLFDMSFCYSVHTLSQTIATVLSSSTFLGRGRMK